MRGVYVEVAPDGEAYPQPCVWDWPYSTFHRLVVQGVYPLGWASGDEALLEYDD